MSKSISRVEAAAAAAGLSIDVKRMEGATRTALEAADQCGCSVGQIVKSLVFRGAGSGRLYLFLVSGDRSLDLDAAAQLSGEKLERAEPRAIRDETGFAIGGVAPIGHLRPLPVFADSGLMRFHHVWAAAGAHDAVFRAEPKALIAAAGAQTAEISSTGAKP